MFHALSERRPIWKNPRSQCFLAADCSPAEGPASCMNAGLILVGHFGPMSSTSHLLVAGVYIRNVSQRFLTSKAGDQYVLSCEVNWYVLAAGRSDVKALRILVISLMLSTVKCCCSVFVLSVCWSSLDCLAWSYSGMLLMSYIVFVEARKRNFTGAPE